MRVMSWSGAALLLAAALPIGVFAGDSPAPPGADTYGELVLPGARLETSRRGAAVDALGTVHMVYGDTVLRHAWNDGTGWRTSTLDAGHTRGSSACVAVDTAGHLHVAYSDSRRRDLWYGTDASGTFSSVRLAGSPQRVGRLPAIAVDAGVAYVAWIDDARAELHLSRGGPAGFTDEMLTTGVSTHSQVDVALDAGGAPHVLYLSEVPSEDSSDGRRAAMLLREDGGGWLREEIEGADDGAVSGVGDAGSLLFAPDGTLHAFYAGQSDTTIAARPLRHAWRVVGGAWERETVDPGNPFATRAAFDQDGRLHLAVEAWPKTRYCVLDGGTWTVSELPLPLGAGLAIDGDDVRCLGHDESRVVVGTSRAGGAFQIEAIDHPVEPLTRPSVAVDAELRARIAVVRRDPDSDAPALDVARRGADAAWLTERVANGVEPVRPGLRVAADGVTHAAFATDDGRIVCAHDDGAGGWTPVDVASGLTEVPRAVALALLPDGRRAVAFDDAAAGQLRVAVETAQGDWEPTDVADAPDEFTSCDLECGADGALQLAFLVDNNVWYATDRDGSWATWYAFSAWGGWGPTEVLDLTLDAASQPHVAVTAETQFEPYCFVAEPIPGMPFPDEWVYGRAAYARSPALGFAPDGGAVVVGTYRDGIVRSAEQETGWRSARIAAAAAAPLRGFATGTLSVTEGGGPVAIAIEAAPAEDVVRDSVAEWLAAAFDAGGGVHAAYIDSRTSDLRFVTDRDPGRAPAGTLRVAVTDPVANAATVTPAELSFGEDDGGTRYAYVEVPQNDVDDEPRTFVVRLVDPTGSTGLGAITELTVTVADDPADVAPPVEPSTGPYLLATQARQRSNGTFVMRGVLHTGALPFDPSAAGVLARGATERTVDGFEQQGKWWVWTGTDGSTFRVRPDHPRTGLHEVRLHLAPAAQDPAADEPFELAFTTDDYEARCTLELSRGRLDLTRGRGGVEGPPLHVATLRVRSGERGSVRMTAYIAQPGERPESAPDIRVRIGELFDVTVAGGDLRTTRHGFASKGGPGKVTLDYRSGRLVVRFPRVSVTGGAQGEVEQPVVVDIGGGPLELPTIVDVR